MFDRTKLLNIGGGVLPRSWQYSSSDDITTSGYFPAESRIQSGDKLTHVVYDRDNATYNTTSYFVDKDDDGILSVQEIPGQAPNLEELSVTPSVNTQSILPDTGYDGFSLVNVSAVTASIDANIVAENIKKDVQILGITGTLEAGGDFQPTRVKDDSDNEIGTHICNFTDANGNTFKVVMLDAQYRNAGAQWCSSQTLVTNMPMYANLAISNIWGAKETATGNTQLILDYCTANGYTSSACTHCRSKSFVINGVTYYGQLPNFIELSEIAKNYQTIETMDTSASANPSLNFSTAHGIWSSSQVNKNFGWILQQAGSLASNTTKDFSYFACPVLEIPA